MRINKQTKKFLSLSSIIFILLFLNASFVSGSNFYLETNETMKCISEEDFDVNIIAAGYDDLDADGLEDDVWIRGNTSVHEDLDEDVYYYLYVRIVLPSGLYFEETFTMFLEENKYSHEFSIRAYNTAIEPGDYTSYLGGFTIIEGHFYFMFDKLIFDPPLDGGVGDPSIFEINIIE